MRGNWSVSVELPNENSLADGSVVTGSELEWRTAGEYNSMLCSSSNKECERRGCNGATNKLDVTPAAAADAMAAAVAVVEVLRKVLNHRFAHDSKMRTSVQKFKFSAENSSFT